MGTPCPALVDVVRPVGNVPVGRFKAEEGPQANEHLTIEDVFYSELPALLPL